MSFRTEQLWRQQPPDIAGKALLNEVLRRHTTYRIGGPAAVMVFPQGIPDVVTTLEWAAGHHAPVIALGAGSNVLAPDEGIDAVVIVLGSGLSRISSSNGSITAQAGVSDEELVRHAAQHGLEPFSWLYDIPGTVGGAIVQNAGMFDWDISTILVEVRHISPRGELTTSPAENLQLGYRQSAFKQRLAGHIIVEAVFEALEKDLPERILTRAHETKIRRRAKYPMDCANCGSVFKRPPGDYAGRLIQATGLGGLSMGKACVSPVHRNFIVNRGGASAADIKALIAQVQQRVYEAHGVMLEREVIFLEELVH